MLPLLLSHELVHPFKFWHDGQLHEGMSSGKDLYRLNAQFALQERQKAFQVATELAHKGLQVCVTCMRTEYKIWVSLRARSQVNQVEQAA
jgi:hypothetical protein